MEEELTGELLAGPRTTLGDGHRAGARAGRSLGTAQEPGDQVTRTRPQFAPQPLRGSSAGAGRLPGPAMREGRCPEPGARREDPSGPEAGSQPSQHRRCRSARRVGRSRTRRGGAMTGGGANP